MTTYLEKLLRWLMPRGNWGAEGGGPESDWGRIWVHAFLGAVFTAPCFMAVHFLGAWGLLSLLLPVLMPFYREMVTDKHPLQDLWVDTPAAIDCRSDILSCWMGSIVMVPFVLVVMI